MHGGRVYEYAQTEGLPMNAIFDFSANLHPLGPPESVIQVIQSSLKLIQHYPDERQQRVKQVLSERFTVPIESLVCGNGASEVMELLFRTVKPKRTWIVDPAFSEYVAIARRTGSKVMRVSLWQNGAFVLPIAKLSQCVGEGDLVVINTPHNPSGRHFRKGSWFETAKSWTERGVDVLIDESFLDFLEEDETESCMRESVNNPHLHTIRSATKIFSIPGLRFGFAVLHPDLAGRINRDRDGWSVNALAQSAMSVAYQDQSWLTKTYGWLREVKACARSTWGAHPRIQMFPFDVNFFLIRLESDDCSRYIQRALQRHGYYVRNCESFQGLGPTYIRIALRTEAENQILWQTFSSLLDGYSERTR